MTWTLFRFKRATIFGFFLILLSHFGSAQLATPDLATRSLKIEQHNLLHFLVNTAAVEATIAQRLSQFIKVEAESIRHQALNDNSLPNDDKVRAIQSLANLMENLRENLSQKKTEYYDIPQALESYKLLLKALLYHESYEEIVRPLSPKRMQLLANAFRGFPDHNRLNDLATYKRIITSPENILKFIETSPNFQFTDSLLVFLAANEPNRLSNYIRRSNSKLVNIIRNHPDKHIQQVVQLSGNRNASELLPFISSLTENEIKVEEVLQKRLDVTVYYQHMVNTLVNALTEDGNVSSEYINALRKGIREKSLAFYVNRINEMHDAPMNVRFAAIKDLRAVDLYYIITSSGEELYTSSYLGLYRKLMDFCKKQSADSLFHKVKFDGFRTFIRMAGNYNTLSDFFGCMPEGTSKELIKRYVSDIEKDTYTGVERAMDVADSFNGLASDDELGTLIRQELQSNYERCAAAQNIFGIRIYDILLQVYDVIKHNDTETALRAQLGEYGKLDRKNLQNKNGEIVELIHFYGDEDGVASFKNFRALYKDSSKWETFQTDRWIRIKSRSEEPLIIYANLPLDNENELDLRAQETLTNYLRQQSIEPSILVHRGHSYHLKYTLRKLHPAVKLAILGSCGGYNNILSVANISPDAQIIVSKKIGSKLVNDPMLDLINNTLYEKNDLVWSSVWGKLTDRFTKDAFTLNLFNEYLPPTKNISLFVLKMFNSTHDISRVVAR